MYYVTVEKTFDAAHYLQGYKGKCEKLHGHRYRIVVNLEVGELDGSGMAYDFTLLKKQLAGILESYDHQCLNDVPPFDKGNPTAENIACSIYSRMLPLLKKKVRLDIVAVWESPESCATYKPG